jgi:hypothetical protein
MKKKRFLILSLLVMVLILIVGCTTPAVQYGTITLQPGPEGIDSIVETVNPTTNYETITLCEIGRNGTYNMLREYIQFDLSTVPADAVVVDANLKLYQYSNFGTNNFTIGLHNVTSAWDESTITWNLQPTCSVDAETTSDITIGDITWKSWEIDNLVQAWLDGSITNYGVVLKDTDEASLGFGGVRFWSSDYTDDTSKRPELVIDYYIP